MRKPLVAGNWKMNKTAEEARSLVKELLPELQAIKSIDRVLCPTVTAIPAVYELIKDTDLGLGAQNMYWKSAGAFTGEISPDMVKEFCQYVILGHSERRAYFGETDETVNKKVLAALENDLIAIVCVGETLEENKANQTTEVVSRQIKGGLKGLTPAQMKSIVIAYEPVWAIGTGLAASGEDANKVVKDIIRPNIKDMFDEDTAQAVRVLYGGSVKANNAAEFFGQPDIDGALVGGASLKAGEFGGIAKAAAQS